MSVNTIPDTELIRRAIASRRSRYRGVRVPLWHVVGETFALGSTYSAELCKRHDFNPDEYVGRKDGVVR
jgi:hypothetical protein